MSKLNGNLRWDGRKLHIVTTGVWRVIGVIFFSWPPLLVLGSSVGRDGVSALITWDKPLIFAILFWTVFLYCWLRVHRFTIDCDKMRVVGAIRHLFYWKGSETPIQDDCKICCDTSYGAFSSGALGSSLMGTSLFIRLRLVTPEKTWLIFQKAVAPAGRPFETVRNDTRELAAKIATELGGLTVEDQVDDERHRIVISPQPGEPSGQVAQEKANSILGCLPWFFIGFFLVFFGLAVARKDSAIAALVICLFGMALLWAGLYTAFRRKRVVFDSEKRSVTLESGWFRSKVRDQVAFDETAQLVIVAQPGGSDGTRHYTSLSLWLIADEWKIPVPGSKSDRPEDVLTHAEELSAQIQLPIALNGGLVVKEYNRLRTTQET
jgi:hypothetical protein